MGLQPTPRALAVYGRFVRDPPTRSRTWVFTFAG
jgi:hypothetical protein